MKQFPILAILLASVFFLPGIAPLAQAAPAQGLKVEALLIWGTDAQESPNPNHKPIDSELAKRLNKSPYRWKHYFEVKRHQVEIPSGATMSNIKMSKHCELNIKNLGSGSAEVALYGEGKLVSRNKESLLKGKLLVLGGNASDETAWFVVIRKVDSGISTASSPVPK
jgi:hypothetical protein